MKIVINIENDDEDTEYELGPDGEWMKEEVKLKEMEQLTISFLEYVLNNFRGQGELVFHN